MRIRRRWRRRRASRAPLGASSSPRRRSGQLLIAERSAPALRTEIAQLEARLQWLRAAEEETRERLSQIDVSRLDLLTRIEQLERERDDALRLVAVSAQLPPEPVPLPQDDWYGSQPSLRASLRPPPAHDGNGH